MKISKSGGHTEPQGAPAGGCYCWAEWGAVDERPAGPGAAGPVGTTAWFGKSNQKPLIHTNP